MSLITQDDYNRVIKNKSKTNTSSSTNKNSLISQDDYNRVIGTKKQVIAPTKLDPTSLLPQSAISRIDANIQKTKNDEYARENQV